MEGTGADAWVRAIGMKDTFDAWEIEPRELIEAGPEQVVAIVRDRARPKGLTDSIDNEFAHLDAARRPRCPVPGLRDEG